MYLYEVATESVCESAARLLFMSIKWAKSVPAFSTLSLQDQVSHWQWEWHRPGLPVKEGSDFTSGPELPALDLEIHNGLQQL